MNACLAKGVDSNIYSFNKYLLPIYKRPDHRLSTKEGRHDPGPLGAHSLT